MLLQKTIVITGAASGIGRALSDTFAQKHARVIAVDCDGIGLAALCEAHAKFGRSVTVVEADVGDSRTLKAAVSGIDFDVWINNAGIHGNGEFLTTNDEFLRRVMSVNFFGVVHGTRLALEHFEKKGAGSIVNMASLSGLVASPYMSLYSASKHAVVGFTRSVQAELRLNRSQTHVLLVSPGFVRTPLLKKDPHHPFPAWLEWSLGTPESVSSAIVKALDSRVAEIIPGVSAKVIRKLIDTVPAAAVPMARMLLADSLTDFFLRRLRRPGTGQPL